MDINVHAFRLVREATDELSPDQRRKSAASSKGGVAGGKARALTLDATRRKAIALAANSARWKRTTNEENTR